VTRPRISRPTKYRNVRWEYGGRKYASKLEANHARRLDMLKSAADPKERVLRWVPQVDIPLRVNGIKVSTYRADFEVMYADGRVEHHECKGMDTPLGKLKMALFCACYPGFILKVIR
jgi:uncharacterized protein DUF1064